VSLAVEPTPDPSALRREVYGVADLSRYRPGQRLTIRLAALAFQVVIALVSSTVRWTVVGAEHVDRLRTSRRRFIATFWHDRIVLATWFWRRRGIVVMTSRSFDGEYIARFIQRFGYGAARGSSSRGGEAALERMAECLAHGIDAGFTIDGPRGPRYVAKRGAVRLAAMSGEPVLPFCIAPRRFWTCPSWDKLQIPRPFTRAVALIGEPIHVAKGADAAAQEAAQTALQASLDSLRTRADAWWTA
jgi:lysophospholipid acyltransferase (LPLAT)-like uncharacterized protein